LLYTLISDKIESLVGSLEGYNGVELNIVVVVLTKCT